MNESLGMTRRGFLSGAVSAAAVLSAANRMYNPSLVLDTRIWLWEAKRRNVDAGSILGEALSGSHRAGYARLQLSRDFLTPSLQHQALAALRTEDLAPEIVSLGGVLHEEAAAQQFRRETLDFVQCLKGSRARAIAVQPDSLPGNRPKTDPQLSVQSYHLTRLGDELSSAGLSLVMRHGLAEMVQDAREWRYLLAHTERRLVSLALDVELANRALVNPVALVDEAGDRLGSVEIRNTRQRQPVEILEEGDVPLPAVARLLQQMMYDGYLVVSLDYRDSTPRKYTLPVALSRSRWYMQEVFGWRQGQVRVDMGPHVRTSF
jgi:sugar phosphate isomerase/epimerase